jgi:putative ABC transport system permease protein
MALLALRALETQGRGVNMDYATMPKAARTLIEAARSLIANKRRTLAIVASLVCGLCALCLIGGYYEYTYWGLGQSLIRSEYGHIELYARGYRATRDRDPFAHPIERADELASMLRADPDIEAVAPRALAFGTAYSPKTGATAVVEVRGVEPDEEASIFTFLTSKRGAWLSSKDVDRCQIAPTLAEELGLGLGDELTLSAVRADDQQNALGFRVKTLAGSYSEAFDRLSVHVPRAAFAELFGFSGAQEIALLLNEGVDPERKIKSLAADLRARGFDLDASLWYEQAAYFKQVLSYFQGFYRVVLLMVALLAFFVVATTVSLSLRERLREFGTRLSMGEGRGGVAAGILAEAFLAGLAGLVAGAAIAFAAASCVNAAGGIPMPPAPGVTASLRVRILFSPQGALLSLLTCLCVPVAAAVLPARSVITMSVVTLLNRGRRG